MAKKHSKKVMNPASRLRNAMSHQNRKDKQREGHRRRRSFTKTITKGPGTLSEYLYFLSRVKHVFTAIERDPRKTVKTDFKI